MFVFVVTTVTDDANDDFDDSGESQIMAVKRTVEQKFSALEAIMNKKMIKSLQ